MNCKELISTLELHRYTGASVWSQGQKWHTSVALGAFALGGAHYLLKKWKARMKLEAKHLVVITGCDSGLGYSLAVHCRNQGAQVYAGVLYDDSPAALDLRQRGIQVQQLNVTEVASIEIFSQTLEKILRDSETELLCLVNNAGVMMFGEFEWLTESQERTQLEVNLMGPLKVTRRLLPLIRKHLSRIINVSSHCAEAPLPGLAVYGATKSGLHGFTSALRLELRKYGVKVISFVPGSFFMESKLLLNQKIFFDEMRAEMSIDAKQFYGNYFERYVQYLTNLPIKQGLQQISNPDIYKIFDAALLDKNPSPIYKCEPWKYTFYHTLFRITPTPVRDWLIDRFVSMPTWTNDDRSTYDTEREAFAKK